MDRRYAYGSRFVKVYFEGVFLASRAARPLARFFSAASILAFDLELPPFPPMEAMYALTVVGIAMRDNIL